MKTQEKNGKFKFSIKLICLLVLPVILVPVITLVVYLFLIFGYKREEVPLSEVMKDLPPSTYYSPEKKTANPVALKVFTEDFYWDISDDNSPFGSDNGADTLSNYKNWKDIHKNGSTEQFMQEHMSSWQANYEQWKNYKQEEIAPWDFLKKFSLTSADDSLIAVGFGQILLYGNIDQDTRKLTVKAIENEKSSSMLKARGWVDMDKRKERLDKMLDLIINFENASKTKSDSKPSAK